MTGSELEKRQPADPPWIIDGRLPWEKQRGESLKAFHAFALYRDLGLTRSLEKVRIAYGEATGKPDGVHIRLVEGWSGKWLWRARVEAYDVEIDRRRREQLETQRERILDAHTLLGQLGVNAAIARLRGREATGADDAGVQALDANEMDWGDVAAVAERFVRIQRMSIGEPTEVVRGALMLSPPQVQELVRDITGIALRYIAEDRQPVFWGELDDYFNGAGRR